MEYNREFRVLASMCGADAKLSSLGALQIIQDNLCIFFGEYNVSQIVLKQNYNSVWVFTKNKIKFYKPLDWDEKCTLTCSFSQKNAVKMIIDTRVYNSNKELALYSRVEVCLISLEAQRIIRIFDDLFSKPVELIPAEPDSDFEKFVDMDASKVCSREIRASSIDYVHHTNNIEYLRFIIDTYDFADLLTKPIRQMEIHYIGQTRQGDNLDIFKAENQDCELFKIYNQGASVLECKINR